MKPFLKESLLTCSFSVTGKNVGAFLNVVSRGGVRVLKFGATAKRKRFFFRQNEVKDAVFEKKPSSKAITITIPYADREKLFAICKEMCYNVKGAEGKNTKRAAFSIEEIGLGGIFKTLFLLKNRPGLIFGALVFIAFAVFLNGRLLGISLDGVPYEYRSAASMFFKERGFKEYADISSENLSELAESMRLGVDGLGFVTIKRRGSFLYVSAIEEKRGEGDFSYAPVTSPVDGEILSLNVLKGTAAVKAGDKVKKGDVLVRGFFTAGEQTFPVTPKAETEIKTERVFTYNLSGNDETYINAVKVVSLEKCRFSRVLGCEVFSEKTCDGYRITVAVTYVYFMGGT